MLAIYRNHDGNTTGSHDGRAHRYQKKKKPFTADELKQYEGR